MTMPRRWPRGYYTYVMYQPDGIPYYVGAGKNNRGDPRRKTFFGFNYDEALRQDNDGRGTLVVIYEQPSKEVAFKLEEELILRYGRLNVGTGTLFNITTGIGGKGTIQSYEKRRATSDRMKCRVISAEERESRTLRMLGNKNLLGYSHTEEAKKSISRAGRGRKLNLSTEERQRRSEAIRLRNKLNPPRKGLACSEEHRRKLSLTKRGVTDNASIKI